MSCCCHLRTHTGESRTGAGGGGGGHIYVLAPPVVLQDDWGQCVERTHCNVVMESWAEPGLMPISATGIC
jgi:hypothetical protein